jgi:integrase
MASVVNRPNGRREVQFTDSAGKRQTVRLGKIPKQFFTAAVRRKLIESNPFAELKSTVQANPERFHFVTLDAAAKVLAACPDAKWRLIFALSRFGGLRCPSEHLALTWDCIDWANDRIRIKSSKTEHHAGIVSRTIPIFPELRPHLEAAFDQAAEGSVLVITRCRDTNTNLRTRLKRIIERAGLEPWPKLFQNLRSTRETELAEQFPIHVVCSWIGNTKAQSKTPVMSKVGNPGQWCTSVIVAEEGLEVAVDFQGKTYILAFADGDSRGINRAERP